MLARYAPKGKAVTDFATLVLAADSRGLKTGEQALDSIAATTERTERRSNKATAGLSKGYEEVGKQSIFAGQQSKMMAMQLSQVAQQASATGNWIQALAIQLPDLTLGFGTIGIAAGVVAGALLPLIANMVMSGDEADKLADAMDDLEGSMKSYAEAVENASQPIADLVGKFGEQAEGAQKVYEALRKIKELEFYENLNKAREAITETLDGLQSSIDRFQSASQMPEFLRPEAIGMMRSETALLANEFGLTAVQATRINDALDALSTADGPQQAADAAKLLGDEISRATQEGAALTPEMRDIQKEAYQASLEAQQFASMISQATSGANGLAGAVAGIANETGRAAQNAAAMVDALRSQAVTNQLIGNSSLDPLNGFNRTPFETEQDIMNRRAENTKSQYQLTQEKLARGSRGGGRKPAKSEADYYDDIVKSAQRRIDSLKVEQEALGMTEEAANRLRYQNDLLSDAQQRGITLTGDQRANLSTLAETMASVEEETRLASEAMEAQRDMLDGVFGDVRSALHDGKVSWDELADVATNALDKIIDKIQDDLVDSLVNLTSKSGGGDLLGGIFSLLGGGASADPWAGMRVASFDGGGSTGKGSRSGGLDGKGGFMALLHPQESVIDHTKGGGGQSVHVTSDVRVSVDENGELKAFVERTSSEVSDAKVRSYDRQMPDRVKQINANPRKRG